jgi:hypothetical protein
MQVPTKNLKKSLLGLNGFLIAEVIVVKYLCRNSSFLVNSLSLSRL